MEVRTLAAQVEDIGEGRFHAVIARFGVPYFVGLGVQEVLEAGCFGNPPPQKLAVCREHDWKHPIGFTERVWEAGNELHAEGRLHLDDSLGRAVYRNLKEKIGEWSVAFMPEEIKEE